MQNLLGVVLCGGQSKRMGTDKGLLPIDNTIRAKYVAHKLYCFNIPVLFSVNELQQKTYAVHIPIDKLVVDDVYDIQGPLRGLLSVSSTFPEKDLLLLACDMLDLDKETIQKLIDLYQNRPGYDSYVYQDSAYAHPFCGIYTAKRLKEISFKAKQHTILQFSMQKILDEGKTNRIPMDSAVSFNNYNSMS